MEFQLTWVLTINIKCLLVKLLETLRFLITQGLGFLISQGWGFSCSCFWWSPFWDDLIYIKGLNPLLLFHIYRYFYGLNPLQLLIWTMYCFTTAPDYQYVIWCHCNSVSHRLPYFLHFTSKLLLWVNIIGCSSS